MSWTWLVIVAAGLYLQKALGPLLLGRRRPSATVEWLAGLVAVPLLAALIVVQTVTDGRSLEVDARLPAVVVAGLCVWRGAPFIVTVGSAAVVAAALRAHG